EHADRILAAAAADRWVGPEPSAHLVRGEAGAGLPYALFVLAAPDLTGCKGRGVFSKVRFVDGAAAFDCAIGGQTVSFRELAVVGIAPSG
ncbi:MAG: hypothetical protein ABMB14_26985, partial [Myxococcota bacterium]